MSSGSPSSFVHVGSSVPAALKSTYRKRDRLVQKRVDLNIFKRDCAHERNRNRLAHEAFNKAAAKFMGQVDYKHVNIDGFPALETAWERLQLSNTRREQQEEKLRKAENEMNTFEDELKTQEHGLYSELQRLSGINTFVSSGDSQSQSSLDTSTYEPTILREYYEKSRQAISLRNQLHEFQAEHREEAERRKLDKELDRSVTPSDKIFLERYFDTLTAMYQQYYTAKHEARDLKLKCREHDLEIEDGEDEMSDMDALEASVVVDKQLIHFAAVNKSTHRGVNPLEALLFGYADTTARVDNWLTNVHQYCRSNDARTPTTGHGPAPRFDINSVFPENLIAVKDMSAAPTACLRRPRNLSVGVSNKSSSTEPHTFDVPFLLRETSFPGERPERRYSDPSLYQRGISISYVPYPSRSRSRGAC